SLCFLTALSAICIIGCVTVIYTAKGRSLDAYISLAPIIRPPVLLSLLSNISSVIRKYLFAEGLAVVWWRAISNGASLADLHFLWSQGKASGFEDTLRHLFRHRPLTYWLMAVFILMNAVSIADGPLLQQAIRPVPRNLTTAYSEPNMGLKTTIDDGWVGTIDNTAPSKLYGSAVLDQVLRLWYNHIPVPYTRCENGTCSGSVAAAGIRTQYFQSKLAWIDLTAPEHQNAAVFSISFNRSVDSTGTPVLLMNHSYLSFADVNCNASIVTEERTFRAATVKYDVHSDGNKLRLSESFWPEILGDAISEGDLPGNDSTPAGPLAALEYFGYYYLRSLDYAIGPDEDGYFGTETSVGTLYNLFSSTISHQPANPACSMRYKNATEYLIRSLNEVMFGMAFASSNGTNPLFTLLHCVTY
ncbi:hypothetical protein DE146DRAFT_619529, partial [Phaeosphaeria sp. MPI-PUGE-AT-0046c]